jgi:type I restriction enzyme S subunit
MGVIGFSDAPGYKGEAILIARVGANAGTTNIVSGKYGVTDNTIILRLKPDCYLPFFFRQLENKRLNRLVYGSGQPLITGSQLKSLTVSVPEPDEQRAIAAALSDVDALLLKLDQLIAKKRDVKWATMHDLLTGTTRLSGFGGKWPEKLLGELFTFSGGYSASRAQLSDEGYCYLHYGDIHTSSKTTVDTRADRQTIPKLNIPLNQISSASLLDDGDVVFVDASEDDEGTSKHVVVVNKDKVPFISGLHTIVAKSRTDELVHQYRRYCFQSAAIKKQFFFYAVGTKVSGISKTNIGKLTLPVPTAAEQQAIAEVLADVDAEIAAIEARRDKTRLLKQGMMQELLTGRIRLV